MGFAILIVTYLWKRSRPRWGYGVALAMVVFLCVAAPLIIYLSREKGRVTFGDSGSVNFAWAMSPSITTRNYQGGPAAAPILRHPTRQLMTHPPVFEFDGPVLGTYPPWTDPSYWNEGLRGHFGFRQELAVLLTTVPSEVRLVFRDRADLAAGIIILALLGGSLWFTSLLEVWPLIALPILALAA